MHLMTTYVITCKKEFLGNIEECFLGNMFISYSCWSVNFPKSNKEHDKAANISPKFDSIQNQLPHSWDTIQWMC